MPRPLTDVKETVTGTIPLPALQLLVLCVLQPAVVEHHPDCALPKHTHTHTLRYGAALAAKVKKRLVCLGVLRLSDLHHLVVELW